MSAPQTYGASLYDLAKDEGMSREILVDLEGIVSLFNEQGRILALRPDFTTSIARMAATKVANSDKPQRYLYTGNVY